MLRGTESVEKYVDFCCFKCCLLRVSGSSSGVDEPRREEDLRGRRQPGLGGVAGEGALVRGVQRGELKKGKYCRSSVPSPASYFCFSIIPNELNY